MQNNVKLHPDSRSVSASDYQAIETWVTGGTAINNPPALDTAQPPITFKEYDDPAYVGPITWNDVDNELSQLLIDNPGSSEHTFNDTMLALDYDSFNTAQVQTYAILGDRGSQEFRFRVTDGQASSAQTVPVTVTSDYVVPKPLPDLPNFTAFYTVRSTGELRRIDKAGNDTSVGFITGYTPEFTTAYRRAETGWLYMVNQAGQRIYVVDGTDASVVFSIALDHVPNQQNPQHRQTLYLIWWRPAEYDGSGQMTRPGELQGLLESREGSDNGDFYVGLGDGNRPGVASERVIVPEYRTRIIEADNAVSVYVWRRATFMTQLIGNGIDRLNALNLVTGKAKNLGEFSFEAKTYMGTDYEARDYFNVRAVLTSEDGAFYGFNQDPGMPPTLFNFDPLERVQVDVPLPQWLENLLNNPLSYGTPFVVVPPRS